ncbi:MAG: 4'-phosphopantetheinyl transferase superfamily protein [Flavobacteriales bacterium]|nr:MAG: 4'-phosphopantetheinyl transferase superfamily protein [Flavobacteriales bacterium]
MPEIKFSTMADGLRWCIWDLQDIPPLMPGDILPGLIEIQRFDSLHHPEIKRQYLGARKALERLLPQGNHSLSALPNGKPILNIPGHISLSHTVGRAAAVYHPSRPCGIDIEDVKRPFAERVIQRFTNPAEMPIIEEFGPAVLWCTKEAVYKAHGESGLHFAKDILVEQTSLEQATARVKNKISYSISNFWIANTVVSVAVLK